MKLMFSLDGIAPLSSGLPSPFPQAVPGESKGYGAVWVIDVDRIEDLGQMALELDQPEVGMEEGHFTTCHIEVNTDDLWCVTFGWHALGEDLDDPFDPDMPLDFFDDEEEDDENLHVYGHIDETPSPGDQILAARIPDFMVREGALPVPSPHWEADTDA